MELYNGVHIFPDIRVGVPTETIELPSRSLENDLKRARFHRAKINQVQVSLRNDSIIETHINADLVTSRARGKFLQTNREELDPDWRMYGLTYEQGEVATAINIAVGKGLYIRGRRDLYGFALDGRRMAVITGDGRVEEGRWYLCDDTGWGIDMEEFIEDLDSEGRFGAIVVNVQRDLKEPPRLTQATPFFYLDEKRRPKLVIPK